MPSIEPRLTLPMSYRRAEAAGLWIVCIPLWAVAVAAVSAAAGAARPWAWAMTAAALVLLPRVIWNEWFQAGVWVWNRAVRLLAPVLRRYVVLVCYYTLFLAVGMRGSTVALTSGGAASGWRSVPSGTGQRRAGATPPASDPRGLLDAARLAGTPWVVLLLPVTFLLRVLSDDAPDAAPPGSTYTLY